MTEERLVEIERLTPSVSGCEGMIRELAAEVQRCWGQIAELQAACNEELERRRKAEDVIRELRAVKLQEGP